MLVAFPYDTVGAAHTDHFRIPLAICCQRSRIGFPLHIRVIGDTVFYIVAMPPRGEEDADFSALPGLVCVFPDAQLLIEDSVLIHLIQLCQGFFRLLCGGTIDCIALFILYPVARISLICLENTVEIVQVVRGKEGVVNRAVDRRTHDTDGVFSAHLIVHEGFCHRFQLLNRGWRFQSQLIQPVLTNPHEHIAVCLYRNIRKTQKFSVIGGVFQCFSFRGIDVLLDDIAGVSIVIVCEILQHIGLGQLPELLLIDHQNIRNIIGGNGQVHLLIIIGRRSGPLHGNVNVHVILNVPGVIVVRRRVPFRNGKRRIDGLHDLHRYRILIFSQRTYRSAFIHRKIFLCMYASGSAQGHQAGKT